MGSYTKKDFNLVESHTWTFRFCDEDPHLNAYSQDDDYQSLLKYLMAHTCRPTLTLLYLGDIVQHIVTCQAHPVLVKKLIKCAVPFFLKKFV